MNILFKLVICICITQSATAQMTFDWVNAWKEGDDSHLYGEWFATDDEGNVIVTGNFFQNPSDVDPGPDSIIVDVPYPSRSHITKFTSDGQFTWTKVLGSESAGSVHKGIETLDIKTDDASNIYVTGYFMDTLYYEDETGIQKIASNGGWDIFFAKLNNAGEWQWIKTYGDIYDDQGTGISISNTGDIYLTGYYAEYVNFIPGGPDSYSDYYDLFVLKFDENDQFQWAYSTDFNGNFARISPNSITVDDTDGVYITGRYFDLDGKEVDFEAGSDSTMLPAFASYDAFVMKLDTSGVFQWAQAYGAGRSDKGIGLAWQNSGSLLITGQAGMGTVDFDPTITGEEINSTNGGSFYLLNLDGNGSFNWVKHFQPSQFVGSHSMEIAVDKSGNIYLQSSFEGSIDADPGPDVYTLNKVSGNTSDAYMVKLDSAANFIWAESFGTSSTDQGRGITTDSYGNVYGGITTGFARSTDTIYFGDIYYTEGHNRYVYKMTSCDTEVIHKINENTLKADAINATYQWVDCDNGYAPLAGETNRTFVANQSGNYALIATNYACSATSACISISIPVVGIVNNGPICKGGNVELTFNATGGTGPFDIVVDGTPYAGVTSGSVFASLTGDTDFTGNTTFELTSINDTGVTPNYIVTVSETTDVAVNPAPAGTISNNGPVCPEGTLELTFVATAGTGPFDIVVNGTPYAGVTNGSVFTSLTEGTDFTGNTTFELTSITDTGDCTATVSEMTDVIVQPALAGTICENNCDNDIFAYPNPTEGLINIDLCEKYYDVTVKVINTLGQLIDYHTFESNQQIALNIKNGTGIYFIEVSYNKGKRAVIKIIKN